MDISSHFIKHLRRALQVGIGAGVLACVAGCARLDEQPELNPNSWAPPSAERIWTPSPASASDYRMPITLRPSTSLGAPAPPSGPEPPHEPIHQEGQPYDLPALLDVALRENPDTRVAWESARQAAANFGASRAPFYPLVSASGSMVNC
jgi:outer membrane protein